MNITNAKMKRNIKKYPIFTPAQIKGIATLTALFLISAVTLICEKLGYIN